MMKVQGDSRYLVDILRHHVPDAGFHGVPCIVGSPPYNVAIPNYPSGYPDHLPWAVYVAYARSWAKAIAACLCPGGRAWINVQPTVPRTPGEPGGDRVNLQAIWWDALERAGLHYRDVVFWVQDSFDGACAWGSWCQPSAPNLRGGYEVILCFYKDRWSRKIPPEWRGRKQPREGPGGDWVDLVRNVWKINPANPGTWYRKDPDGGPPAKRKNLPALYPIELPQRVIRLSTWPGEWVVDPWAGHCTTGYAADGLDRPSLMVDLGYGDDRGE